LKNSFQKKNIAGFFLGGAPDEGIGFCALTLALENAKGRSAFFLLTAAWYFFER
jgi:hypothetical protein